MIYNILSYFNDFLIYIYRKNSVKNVVKIEKCSFFLTTPKNENLRVLDTKNTSDF